VSNVTATPITIIIRDPKENPKKCSILPLQGRPDIRILTYPVSELPLLESYVRLAAEGPALSGADCACGILLLDGSWRSAAKMNAAFRDVPPRSLSGWKTAYPRASKLGTDPANGLASIEAIYIAYRLIGRSTEGLLDHYRWADSFLELNGLATETSTRNDD
jgi:pre-rRNA-processing protein TSR3